MKKIIFSLILIMILSFTPVYESYADAGSITIAGGSIGVAGLGAAGLAGLTGPVVVAVFCGALAFGMNVELTKQSEAAGMTKTQFIKNKIEEYCNEANITLGVFNNAILSGMNVLNDGRISLTDQAAKQIKQFYNWLFNTNQVIENTPSSDGLNVNLGDYNFPCLNTGERINLDSIGNKYLQYYSGSGVLAVGYFKTASGNGRTLGIITNTFGSRYLIGSGIWGGSNFSFAKRGSYYITSKEINLTSYNVAIPYISDINFNTFIDSLDGTFNPTMDAPITSDTFTGSRDDYNTRSGVLDPTAGQTVVVNPGLTIPVPADKDLTIDVNSYLEAIQKVLDKLNDITIPAVDDADGIPTEIDIPDETVIDPTIEKEDDTDLPDPEDTTPVINEDDTPVGPAAVEPLKFNLRYIFPFCIPFDVKDMISMLSAEPEAPRYHVSWEIPWINENLEFTVDLSQFDSVAEICRKMELLLFVVGLAVVTRSMFIRS